MSRDLERLEFPCGLGGLNGSKSPIVLRIEDLVDCEGVSVEDDTWKKEGGASKFNSPDAVTGTPKLTLLHDFVSDAGVQELLSATSDGRYITIAGGGLVKTLTSGLATNRPIMGAEGSDGTNKYFYLVNGVDMMRQYNGGATAVNVTTPAADWATVRPSWLFQYRGRMFAGGKPHGIYVSLLDNHSDYASAGSLYFNLYPGEGERIVGGISWRQRAYVFKYPRGIYVLNDDDPDPATWNWVRVSKFIGAAGIGCLVEADDDVWFLTPEGYFCRLSAVQESGDVKSAALFPEQIGPIVKSLVNFTRMDFVQAVWHASSRRILFGVSLTGETVNTLRFIIDLHATQRAQFLKTMRDDCESLCVRRNPNTGRSELLAGSRDGFVWLLDQEERSKETLPYISSFETKEETLFDGLRYGNLREMVAEFKTPDSMLAVEVIHDGVSRQTVNFIPASTEGSPGLDVFELDADSLGQEESVNVRKRLYGEALRIKLRGSNNHAEQTYSLAKLIVRYTPGKDAA